jgi:hypothetical protein
MVEDILECLTNTLTVFLIAELPLSDATIGYNNMAQFEFEQTLFTYLENIKQQLNIKPLNLGGVFGAGGGIGGPPGGFIGYLPQTRISFDTTEGEVWDYPTVSGVPSGVSLVTNLNRIRYRLSNAEVKQVVYSFEGTAIVAESPIRIYNFLPGKTITAVYVSVGTAPTGASLIVDIHKNGTTIFTNQSHRPTITAGNFYGVSSSVDVPSWNTNDYLTAFIDQVGSTIAGEYPIVYVVYE